MSSAHTLATIDDPAELNNAAIATRIIPPLIILYISYLQHP
jgi:hypothetical protein